MKSVVLSAALEPCVRALLAAHTRTAVFQNEPVQYLLVESIEVGVPFTTLSLPDAHLRLELPTHGIAAVLSGEGVRQMGFASAAAP